MILLGKIALSFAGAGLAGAGVLCSEGFVHVKVHEKQPNGTHFSIVAPAMLAPIAAHLAPRSALTHSNAQLRQNLPVVRAALEGLRDCDDVVLVEVHGPGEYVHIATSGGSIIVDVDDPDDTVHISAPIRAISSTVDQIADRQD
jgi:hypothetical protein